MCEKDVCVLDPALLDLLNRRLNAEKGIILDKMIRQITEQAEDLARHSKKLTELCEQLKINHLPDDLLKDVEAYATFAASDLWVLIATLKIIAETRRGRG